MRVVEETSEFVSRHSKEGQPIRMGSLLIFSDGASIVDGTFPQLREPPADDLSRLKLQEQWASRRLAIFQEHFGKMRQALTHPGNPYRWNERLFGQPSDDPIECLTTIKRHVLSARERLEEIQAAIADLPEVRARRQRQEAVAEGQRLQQERARELAHAAAQVSI